MPRFSRGQFSTFAFWAALTGVSVEAWAADLPPFAVDPALLGLPPILEAPSQSATPPKASAPKAVEPVVADKPAASTPVTAATPSTPIPAPPVAADKTSAKKQRVAAVPAPAPKPEVTSPATAATPMVTPLSEPAKGPSPAVVITPVKPLAATQSATQTPEPAAAPAVRQETGGVVRNMAVFKVDPALLGLPSDNNVTATAVARTQPGTPPGVLPAPLPARAGRKGKGELVPGQVMPEDMVVESAPGRPAVPAARPGHGVARNMPAFRVDPSLLEPADRTPVPLVAAVPETKELTLKTGKKPLPRKLSIVPGATIGGVYFPPVYAGASKDRKSVPVYVTADRIDGTSGVQSIAKGNADLIKADSRLRGDEIIYREQDDEVESSGNVILTRETDEISGPHLKLKLGDSVGYFDAPVFKIEPRPSKKARRPSLGPATTGYGTAERLDFEGEDHYHLSKATYSSCSPESGDQAWFAKVADLNLDYDTSIGEARDATIYFKGTPILYSPWLNFSLNRQRKSGFLSPTWGTTTNAGMEFSTPYYWNIAPEMDATITPRVMARRGTQFIGEFRYLGNNVPSLKHPSGELMPSYQGTINAEYLSNDKLAGASRHLLNVYHTQNFGNGFSGVLNVSGVSDDNYFTDLSSTVSTIAQTNLLRQGTLTYGAGWWTANATVQRYQTLQPSGQVVVKPYERVPQVTLSAIRPDFPLGTTFNFSGEYVSFRDPNGGVQGQRTTMYPQISLPLQTAAFYVTPKFGVHNTRYQLEQQALGSPDSLNRSVPIFSVDSGVVFERDTNFNGRDLIQTLEPRLYYLNVPLRDQSQFPVFDTGIADFNFAQIFAENTFSGGDRIADANQATLAVSSRLISPNTGAELARVAVGQRWYFSDQSVLLPGQTPRNGHVADYLGSLSLLMERSTAFDSAIQYNPRDQRLERFNASVRYQPETGRLLNAGYRFSRDLLSQVDVSGQWPIGGGWSAVGRYNYSFRDRKLVENLLGLEYNESCWALRFVVQRVATTTGQVNNTFFAQLQLNGFSSLGTSPINLLRRSVAGYDKVVETEEVDETEEEKP